MKQRKAYNLANNSGKYSREQYNKAYDTAISAIKRNAPAEEKMRGRKLKEKAQEWIINAWNTSGNQYDIDGRSLYITPKESYTAPPAVMPDLGDVYVEDDSIDKFNSQIAREAIMNKYENLHRFENEEPIAVPLVKPNYVFGNYTQSDLDKMSFNDAFGTARKAGQKTFYWRVGQNPKNKSGWYGTKLKSEVTSNEMEDKEKSKKEQESEKWQQEHYRPGVSNPKYNPNPGPDDPTKFDGNSYPYTLPPAPDYNKPPKPGQTTEPSSENESEESNKTENNGWNYWNWKSDTSDPSSTTQETPTVSRFAGWNDGISILGVNPFTGGSIINNAYMSGDSMPVSYKWYYPIPNAAYDANRGNYWGTYGSNRFGTYTTFEPKSILGPQKR